MASQSRSQRRRQQQRARAQQRPAAPAPARPVDKHPPKANIAAPVDTTTLAEDEAENLATPATREEAALPVASAIGQRSHSTGRVAPEREMATGASSRRQRRQVRPTAEAVDYTLDYAVARHDLRRIAILATLLLAAMIALRVSGVL
ncbi:hypothetical protein [Roseiflexus sp.]|uniref:hypothetical protein n=1 Tax=Roseiflexus sp. TaxID=2562120 RepID=UPI0021DE4E28|nr:hypothetical protein [Roseiflexus sp.]GIW01003.1 MAG: hypothetical protein KatS3mg058_2406 [Roseiflexus sp.]